MHRVQAFLRPMIAGVGFAVIVDAGRGLSELKVIVRAPMDLERILLLINPLVLDEHREQCSANAFFNYFFQIRRQTEKWRRGPQQNSFFVE